jgi:hypothetical protein
MKPACYARQLAKHQHTRNITTGALVRDISDSDLWLALGVILNADGQYARAVTVYRAAARAFPRDERLRVNYAQVLSRGPLYLGSTRFACVWL